MKFAKAVVSLRIPILIITLILIIPSIFGIINTRVNYDMLTYLPKDMETVIGQNELLKDFNKGAFSIIIVEDMKEKEVSQLKNKIQDVKHVDSVLWYDSIFDLSVPMEILPESIYKEFNTDNATIIAVFFDTSTSSDLTMNAVKQIKKICGKQCFVSGMTALVVDLKDLCEREEPIYVGLAVILSLVAMLILLDNWLIPFFFLASIGIMIVLNLGSNIVFGEISYITKALSAVLQLAVTMDYSIFLWHSYNEQSKNYDDKKEAMAVAVKETFTSVIGSSVTTIAGFIALCFMSFTLGKDLGIVMAKGVLFGVVGSVTLLPSLILVFDKLLSKAKHKPLIPELKKFSSAVVKIFPALLIVFVLLITPAYYGYSKAKDEVYYNIAETLPKDMDYIIANSKLSNDFKIGSTHMILTDSKQSQKTIKSMIKEMQKIKGVKFVLGLDAVLGSGVPEEIIPESIKSMLKNDKWELLLINSEYRVATEQVDNQLTELKSILKKYDNKGMLIGEAPCTLDMIKTTDTDFRIVNIVSVALIFIIILFVEKSITLPIILISVIELGIFINLGLPHYLGQSMAFITPICISTIQLGATVDYAILLTTRYKSERISGNDKKTSVFTALKTSAVSIVVSGFGLFAATFGVALYSDIEIISSMCMLLARGAIISMILVIFFLPAMFMLFDKVILKTTLGMTKINN